MRGEPLPPYFRMDPDLAAAELGDPTDSAGFAEIARACDPGRPRLARTRRERAPTVAPLLDLGNHPLPDPGRARAFSPGAAAEPRAATGPLGDRGRRQVVQPRRGAAAARAFRRRGIEGQALSPLSSQGTAREDGRGGQLQGRRRQDLDGGASGDVGGAGWLQGAGARSRQPGLDDLDLRRQGRG